MAEHLREVGVEKAADGREAVVSYVEHVDGEGGEGAALGWAKVVEDCWSAVR
jgi:hypothetical protein